MKELIMFLLGWSIGIWCILIIQLIVKKIVNELDDEIEKIINEGGMI